MERKKTSTEKEQRGGGEWSEETKEEFRKAMEGVKETTEKVINEIRRSKAKGERQLRQKKEGWWDEECKVSKAGVRRELRKWRRIKGGVRRKKKAEHKRLCERKKEEERARAIKEIEGARTEQKAWEIVNGGRKKRARVNEEIKGEEWKEHFVGLLGGAEERVKMGMERGEKGGREEGISREEIVRTIGKMKEEKAAGIDEIPNEVWKCGGQAGIEIAWDICKRVAGELEGRDNSADSEERRRGEGRRVQRHYTDAVTIQERRICTKWITKLCQLESNDPVVKKNRNDFFKYMLIILHRSLDERPHDYGFPQYDARNKLNESMGGKPFLSRWSPDRRTYVAIKPIPQGGALVYMAVAKDPSLGWEYTPK